MGIKNFLTNFNNYKFKTIHEYDNIYIDGNYLLYTIIYKCCDENDLKQKVNNFVYQFYNNILIKNKLYIIFDGYFDSENKTLNNPKIYKEKKITDSPDYDKQIIKPKTDIIKTFKYL